MRRALISQGWLAAVAGLLAATPVRADAPAPPFDRASVNRFCSGLASSCRAEASADAASGRVTMSLFAGPPEGLPAGGEAVATAWAELATGILLTEPVPSVRLEVSFVADALRTSVDRPLLGRVFVNARVEAAHSRCSQCDDYGTLVYLSTSAGETDQSGRTFSASLEVSDPSGEPLPRGDVSVTVLIEASAESCQVFAIACASSSVLLDGRLRVRPADVGSNDHRSAARELGPLPFGRIQSTSGAGLDEGEPQPCGEIGATVWYRFDAPAASDVLVDSAGSDFPTVLAAYRETDGALAGCATGAPQGGAALHLSGGPGVSYLLQAGGQGGASGRLVLRGTPCDPGGDADGDGLGDCTDARFGALTVLSGPSPFGPSCHSDAQLGTEAEPSVAVNPSDPRQVVALFQQDRFPDGGAPGLGLARSADGGASWQTGILPQVSACSGGAYERASDPWVSAGADGTLYAASLSFDQGAPQATRPTQRNALLVSTSRDGGQTWSSPLAVVQDDALLFSDKEAITADPRLPGRAYLVWARIAAGQAPAVFFSRTDDYGRSWLPPRPIPAWYLGNQVVVLADGSLVDVYLGACPPDPGRPGFMICATRSLDGGLTWLPPVAVGPAVSWWSPEGEIRAPAMPSAAAGPDGSLWVVWPDLSQQGYTILLARSADGGLTWSSPQAVYRGEAPAFLPQVTVTASGTVAVAFYDLRSSGRRELVADVWLRWAAGGVGPWREARLAGPFDYRVAPEAGGRFLGDYFGLAAAGERIHAVFALTPPGPGPASDVVHVTAPLAP